MELKPPVKLKPPKKPIRKQFYPLFKGVFFGLVFAGLFSAALYVFADPPDDVYDFSETLEPNCLPGTTNCTVQEPAVYPFGANNFVGTGGFTGGSLTIDTNTLFVNPANHRVGVGTAGPEYDLDVNGNINIASGFHYKINGVNLSYSDVGAQASSANLTSLAGLSSIANLTSLANLSESSGILTNNGLGTLSWEAVSSGMVYPAGSGIPIVSGGAFWGTTITDNHANWDTAYSDRLKWSGGATGLDAATGRTSLGLEIGTDVQAYNATLASLAGLANSSGVLTNNGSGTLSWSAAAAGLPAGSNTQIQYNNSGAFGASANFTYDGSTLRVLSASAAQAKLSYNGTIYTTLQTGSDGTLTVANTGGATGDIVLQPTGTGDVALLSDTGKMALGGNANTNNENLTFDFESSNDLVWIASTTGVSNIAWTGSITMGGATAGTLVTRTKAGAPDESDPVGSIVVDTVDNAIYFKTATGTWHYAATGGFQIPDQEKTDPISGDRMKEGDIVMGMIDKTMSGNDALHGVWVKWDSVKAQLLAEAKGELSKTGTLGEGSVAGVQTETLLGKVTNVLFSLGISVKDGVAQITQLAVKKLSAKNARVETLEMVDKATGKIYCTWLENGEIMKAKGQCESVDVSTAKSQIVNQVTLQAQKTAKQIAKQVVDQSAQQTLQLLQGQIQEQIQEQVQLAVQQQLQEQLALLQRQESKTQPEQPAQATSGTMIKNAAASLIKSIWEFAKWIFAAPFNLISKLIPTDFQIISDGVKFTASAIIFPLQKIFGK